MATLEEIQRRAAELRNQQGATTPSRFGPADGGVATSEPEDGGGFFGAIGEGLGVAADAFRAVVPQEARDRLGAGARFATSGEYALNTVGGLAGNDNLGTDIVEKAKEVPYVGGALGAAVDIGAAPLTLLTAGAGAQISAGLRGLGAAGKVSAALIDPISGSPNFGSRLMSEIVMGAGTMLTAEQAEKHGLPAPLALGVGILGGATALGLKGMVTGAGKNILRDAPTIAAERWGLDLGDRTYLNNLRPLEDVVSRIDGPTNALEASRFGRGVNALVNPSKNIDSDVGRLHLAFTDQRARGHQLAEVGVGAALDPFNKGTGRAVGVGGSLFDLDENGVIKNIVAPDEATSRNILDVFSDPKAPSKYQFSAEQTAYYDAFHQVNREIEDLAVTNGLPRPKNTLEDTLYVMRVAQGTAEIDYKRLNNPNLARVFETAQEGVAAGVRYENDPRSILLLQSQRVYNEIADTQFNAAMAPHLVKGKDIVKRMFPDTVGYVERTAKRYKEAQRAARAGRQNVMRELSDINADIRAVEHRLKDALKRGDRAELYAVRKELRDLRKLTPRVTSERGPAVTAATRDTLQEAKSAYMRAKGAYRKALERVNNSEAVPEFVFGNSTSNKTIRVGRWKGQFLPETADYLKLAEQVNTITGRPYPVRLNPMAKGVEDFGNVIRFASATADFGMPFIQGLPLLGQNPVLWAKMTAAHYRAALDPSFAGRYLKQNLNDVQELAALGIPIGDVEQFLATKGGLIKKFGESGVGRQTLGRFESAYEVGNMSARLELYKSLKPVWDGTQEELATYIRDMTGALSSAALGVSRTQRALESTWLGFSPRLMRSTIALVAHAADPSSPVGRQAARSLLGLAAVAAGMAVTTRIGVGLAQGQSQEEIQQGIEDMLNPLGGRKFLSIPIEGQYIGVGGQVRAITQFVAKTLANPAGLATANSLENPLINYYMGRGAVGVNIAGGIAEAATGGRVNVLPFEQIDTLPDLALHFGTSLLPFSVQAQFEGEAVSGIDRALLAVSSIAGMNATPKSASMVIDELAMAQYGKPYTELLGTEQQEMEAARPDLFERKQNERDNFGTKEDRERAAATRGVDSTRLVQERSLVDALERGLLSPQQFRNEMKAIQRDAAVAKRTLRGDQEFPEASDANKQALTDWYNVFDAAKIPGTEVIDWDKHADLEASFLGTLTASQRQFIDERRVPEHAPEAAWFFAAEDAIQASGYYDTIDSAFEAVRSSMPTGIESYSDLVLALNRAVQEGDVASARVLTRLQRRADAIASREKRALRFSNPELDRALLATGRVTTQVQ